MNAFAQALFLRRIVPWLVLLVLAGLGIGSAWYWLDEQVMAQQQTLQRQQQQYRALYGDVQFLLEQYALLQQYGEAYWTVRQNGLVSEVARDRWVDRLLLFSEAYGFDRYAHVFQPAVKAADQQVGTARLDGGIFHINPVVTQASMPTDVDFLRFYRYFREAVTPYALINRCQFSLQEKPVKRKRRGKKRSKGRSGDRLQKPFETPFVARCEWAVITAEPRQRPRR